MTAIDTKAATLSLVAIATLIGGMTVLVPDTVSAQGAAAPDASARCAALTGMAHDGLVIQKAELVPAGRAPAPPGSVGADAARTLLPEHCRIQGVINPRTGVGGRSYGIGFKVRMPVAWNGRFLLQGGAGLDGQVMPAIGTIANSTEPPALARGFAVASTDAGHQGSLIDASFGLDQQARIDYAYNALDKVTIEAKALIARFYGKAADYSYMLGCSNGGRQALTVSQRLPLYFDGIVAGDPSMRFSRVAIDEVWNVQVLSKIAPKDAQGRPLYFRAFSDDDLKLVRNAVLKRCDAKDGLADGMINDWQRCDFDPAVLTCKAGKTDLCLSAAQVSALHDLHRGPRMKDGTSIYGPFNYDTGIASSAWRGMRLGSSQGALPADATLGAGQFKYFQLTPPDPNFDPLATLDYDKVIERVRSTAAMADADSPFLTSFARHGKMIVYNGLSDQGLASSEIADWYQKVIAATGPQARDAVRLFLVPGMLHCGGGEATDQFEMLDAIMDWVEHGKAPERIIATGKRMPGLSRPLCPFPKVARYKGGDTSSADSFECAS